MSCECKSTQCRSQSITDATQSAFLNFPRCSTFPRFLSHNVNVNLMVCSCSVFSSSNSYHFDAHHSRLNFDNVNVTHSASMLMFKAARPCFCQRISLCWIKKLQNEFNSSADIVRAVTTNIIRHAHPQVLFRNTLTAIKRMLQELFLTVKVFQFFNVLHFYNKSSSIFWLPAVIPLSCSTAWWCWGGQFPQPLLSLPFNSIEDI